MNSKIALCYPTVPRKGAFEHTQPCLTLQHSEYACDTDFVVESLSNICFSLLDVLINQAFYFYRLNYFGFVMLNTKSILFSECIK